ncbi:MAG: cation transporter [Candidatus Gastranaerophilales bacterium]|nr:cation transporter [Candidatus Gastranaerophilales bacterium]
MIDNIHSAQNHSARSRLLLIISLTALYMIAEIVGGIWANSLALLADAGHMLGDLTALCMSFWASVVSEKPASAEKTYGYYRTEIVVALANGLLLVGIGLFIVFEAIKRIISPPEVNALIMIAVALGGLGINVIGLLTLHSSAKHNLNIKGAFINILGDAIGSIGAIIAGVIIYFYKFYYADLIISFIIATLIIYTASGLIRESSNILLEGTPKHIDINEIKRALMEIEEVKKVHELHVWSISQNRIALSVHIVSDCHDSQKVLQITDTLLREKFNINHLTIQVESSDFPEKHCDF